MRINFLILGTLILFGARAHAEGINGTWTAQLGNIECTRQGVVGLGTGSWTFAYDATAQPKTLTISGTFDCAVKVLNPNTGKLAGAKWMSTSKTELIVTDDGALINPKTNQPVGLFTPNPANFGFSIGNSSLHGVVSNATPKDMTFQWESTGNIARYWKGKISLP